MLQLNSITNCPYRRNKSIQEVVQFKQKLQSKKARKNLPQNLKQPLKVSKFVQLYLLKRENAFRFHFLDMLNNEFITQIGPQINCTCIPGYYDHCIHSFYVLRKIFKLKDDDPLMCRDNLKNQNEGEQLKRHISYSKKKLFNSISQKIQNIKDYSLKDLQTLLQLQKDPQVKNKQILRNLKSMNNDFDFQFNHSLIIQDGKIEPVKSEAIKFQIQTKQLSKSQLINETKGVSKPSQKNVFNNLLNELKLQFEKEQKELFGEQQPLCCPICHQNITYETPAYQCKQKCKNFYHIKCLKFWVKHQRKNIVQNDRVDEQSFEHRSSIRVTCPMCRTQFSQNIDQQLIQTQFRFKKYYQSQNTKCSECNQEIYLKLFHCLLCKSVNICESCYKGWKHQKHDRFLMKAHRKSQWQVPLGRSAFNMSKLQFSLEYIKKLTKKSGQSKTEGQIKQLFGENYSQFLEQNFPKPQFLEYLKESFINVEKEIHKTYKNVDFNEETLKCAACKKSSIVGMKRMYCTGKHFLDQKCLNFFLKNNFFQCPLDKTFFLEGLEGIDLNLKEKVKKQTKLDKSKKK